MENDVLETAATQTEEKEDVQIAAASPVEGRKRKKNSKYIKHRNENIQKGDRKQRLYIYGCQQMKNIHTQQTSSLRRN